MGVFLKHTACGNCGSSDALAHYDNGSTYCWSCGAVSGADRPGFVSNKEGRDWALPHDLSTDNFPIEFFQWLEPTGLKLGELLAHNYFFSKSTGRVWRLFQQLSAEPVCGGSRGGRGSAESRRINGTHKGPKARFYGSKEETFAYSGSDKLQLRNSLVIVEDSLSAIKTGRHCCSIPLFGSSISNSKLAAICKNGLSQQTAPLEHIYVWLDSDKLRAAHSIAERIAMLGIKSVVINTDLDPKYLNAEDYIK